MENHEESDEPADTTEQQATFDSETMDMLVANLPQNMFRSTDPRLQRALQETERTNQITPVLKEELRLRILSKRLENGQPELFPDSNTPRVYELTEEEKRKRERRKEQNRRAAKKCRERRKMKNMSLAEHTDTVCEDNQALKSDISILARHKEALEKFCLDHIWSGHCPQVPTDPVSQQLLAAYFNDDSKFQVNLKSNTASTQTPYTLDSPLCTATGPEPLAGMGTTLFTTQLTTITSLDLEKTQQTASELNHQQQPHETFVSDNNTSVTTCQNDHEIYIDPSPSTAHTVGNRQTVRFIDSEPLVPSGFEVNSSHGSDQSTPTPISPNSLFHNCDLAPRNVFTIHLDTLGRDYQCIQQQGISDMNNPFTESFFQSTSLLVADDSNTTLSQCDVFLGNIHQSEDEDASYSINLDESNAVTMSSGILLQSSTLPDTRFHVSSKPSQIYRAISPATPIAPVSPVSPLSPASPNPPPSPSSPNVLLNSEIHPLCTSTSWSTTPFNFTDMQLQSSMSRAHVFPSSMRSITPKIMASHAIPLMSCSQSTMSAQALRGTSSQLSLPTNDSSVPAFNPVLESPHFLTLVPEIGNTTIASFAPHAMLTHHQFQMVSPVSSNCSDNYSPIVRDAGAH